MFVKCRVGSWVGGSCHCKCFNVFCKLIPSCKIINTTTMSNQKAISIFCATIYWLWINRKILSSKSNYICYSVATKENKQRRVLFALDSKLIGNQSHWWLLYLFNIWKINIQVSSSPTEGNKDACLFWGQKYAWLDSNHIIIRHCVRAFWIGAPFPP